MTLGAHPIVHIKIPKPVAFSEIPLPSTVCIYILVPYIIPAAAASHPLADY